MAGTAMSDRRGLGGSHANNKTPALTSSQVVC